MSVSNCLKSTLSAGLIAVAATVTLHLNTAHAEPRGWTSFKEDVFPIFQIRCLECHQPGKDGYKESGLDLSSYEGLMKGTKYGPVVVPGSSMVSNLNVLVEGRAAVRMPHNKKRLTRCEIEVLRHWVNQGARNN